MTGQQTRQPSLRNTGLDRRTFLKGSAGSMAFLVVQSAVGFDVAAQEADPLAQGRRFFTPQQFQTVEAIAERIWPATEGSPGAIEAGAVHYIDHALAGPYASFQLAYRDGLLALDEVSQAQHTALYRNLTPEQQDALLAGIDAGEVTRQPQQGREDGPSGATEDQFLDGRDGESGRQIAGLMPPTVSDLQSFFGLVRAHTMEGLFADPIYGGNRDFAGWRAVGYPGPHYVYTEEEQQSFEPLNKPLQSIADL
jgi:gluconate 2-dehydrogenase gamma chain